MKQDTFFFKLIYIFLVAVILSSCTNKDLEEEIDNTESTSQEVIEFDEEEKFTIDRDQIKPPTHG